MKLAVQIVLISNLISRRIGAGTGIFTRALLAHPDWADAIKELRAVEPSAGMRDVFSKTVTDPRVSVREGTFDTTGVEDGWADLIIIAQVCRSPVRVPLGTNRQLCRARPSTGARTMTRRLPSLLARSSPEASSPSSGTSKIGPPTFLLQRPREFTMNVR